MKVLFFLFLTCNLFAYPCLNEAKLLKEKHIDLDTKTLKGWVRLLNNRSKQQEYGVTLSKEETTALIKCLTLEIEYKSRQGKMQ